MRNILNSPTQLIIYSILGIFVIAYFISPIDLIPDTVGIIGYIDDLLTILAFAIGIIKAFYTVFMEENEAQYNQIRGR